MQEADRCYARSSDFWQRESVTWNVYSDISAKIVYDRSTIQSVNLHPCGQFVRACCRLSNHNHRFLAFNEQDKSAANSSLPDLVNASLAPAVLICFGSQVSFDRDVRENT